MGVVGFLVRAAVRRRLVSFAALAGLVGLAGGVVLAAWAGARRTDSAYPRLLERTAHYDVSVTPLADIARFDPEVARGAPGVERVGILYGFGAFDLDPEGLPDFESGYYFTASSDRIARREMARPELLEGRLPDPARADEVVVNETARRNGATLGSAMPVCLFDFPTVEQYPVPPGEPTAADLRRFVDEVCSVHRLEVVGVGRFAEEIALSDANEGQSFIAATPALLEAASVPPSYGGAGVDLAPGASLAAFTDHLLAHVDPAAGVQVQPSAVRTLVVERTAAPYVQALTLFAAVAAVAAIGVLGPAVARWAGIASDDRSVLLAAGVRPGELRLAAALRGLALGVAGALVAVGVALAASPSFPVGPVRQAEPLGGVRGDALVLLVGVVVVVAVAALLGAAAPVGGGRRDERTSALAERLATAGAGAPLVLGVRAAFGRTRSGAGPVATAAGVTIALAAVVAALAYQAGLARLLDTPDRYGWTWDALYESYEDDLDEEVLGFLAEDDLVDAAAIGHRAVVTVGGEPVPIYGFEDLRGSIRPEILEGALPTSEAEVALGAQTLERLDARLGDEIELVGAAGDPSTVTVVGRTVLPLFNAGEDLTIGEGAFADPALLDRLGGAEAGFAVVSTAGEATGDDLRRALVDAGLVEEGGSAILGSLLTADLAGYDRVRSTPLLLAGLLAVLGVGVLAHTLVASTAGRRRQLGVLKAIGFDRRGIAATVRWHAVALVGACILVAVPAGLAVGRTLWSRFAGDLGVVDDAVTPVLLAAAVAAAALLLAVGLAVVPGHRAATQPAATHLRSE